MTNPLSDTCTYTYAYNGWLGTQRSKVGGATQMVQASYTYAPDARGLLTDLKNADLNGNTLSEFGSATAGSSSAMTYDAAGNRLAMPVSFPNYTAYAGTTTYAYDYKDELTQEATTRNGGLTNNFAYDVAGNFTENRNNPYAPANADNQYSNTSYYTYDGDGNPTTYYYHPATFDPESRMTKFVSGGVTEMQAGYGYDGLRAWRTDQSGTTLYYVYDGDTPVVELSSTGSSLNAINTWGADGLVSRATGTAASAKHFYAFDPQGSPAEIVSGAGGSTLVSEMNDAFGNAFRSGTNFGLDASYFEAYCTRTNSGGVVADTVIGYVAQWSSYTDSETELLSLSF